MLVDGLKMAWPGKPPPKGADRTAYDAAEGELQQQTEYLKSGRIPTMTDEGITWEPNPAATSASKESQVDYVLRYRRGFGTGEEFEASRKQIFNTQESLNALRVFSLGDKVAEHKLVLDPARQALPVVVTLTQAGFVDGKVGSCCCRSCCC